MNEFELLSNSKFNVAQEAEKKKAEEAKDFEAQLAQATKESENDEMRRQLELEKAAKNAQLDAMFNNAGAAAAGGSGAASSLPSIGGKGKAAALFDEIQIKDDDTDDVKANKENKRKQMEEVRANIAAEKAQNRQEKLEQYT